MFRHSRFRVTILAGVALLAGVLATNALAADAHTGPWPQARGGWLIGFGIGGGSAGLTDKTEPDSLQSDSNREGGGTGSFHVGYAFNPEIALEFYSGAWTKSEDGGTVSFTTGTAALTYFPGGQGLLLRGGVGFGSVDFSADVGNVTLSLSETGFGALGSVGYQFRVKRTFAIGPEVNYNYISTDSFTADWVDGEITFTWYFLPKP